MNQEQIKNNDNQPLDPPNDPAVQQSLYEPSAEEARRMKVDISSKVAGHIHEGKIVFEVDDMEIGQMGLTSEDGSIELHEGYGIEDGKIYQIQVEGQEEDHYVEGCNMGWC
ncbi:DUF2553 family protein [Caldalkalibacillus salinus]|uniref:DUF2553 family protein n=1 Tax=Caldalkalibacillus salinus TaxID=2803787 RepID=UPI0019235B9D|nr:DUF2553 family protein [Caldalkalibacillus salinus]